MTEQTPDAGRRSGWFKSSFSTDNGHCVEVRFMTGADWVKSSFSTTNGSCVEVRFDSAVTGVRDSKNPAGPQLAVGRTGWAAFLAELSDGR